MMPSVLPANDLRLKSLRTFIHWLSLRGDAWNSSWRCRIILAAAEYTSDVRDLVWDVSCRRLRFLYNLRS